MTNEEDLAGKIPSREEAPALAAQRRQTIMDIFKSIFNRAAEAAGTAGEAGLDFVRSGGLGDVLSNAQAGMRAGDQSLSTGGAVLGGLGAGIQAQRNRELNRKLTNMSATPLKAIFPEGLPPGLETMGNVPVGQIKGLAPVFDIIKQHAKQQSPNKLSTLIPVTQELINNFPDLAEFPLNSGVSSSTLYNAQLKKQALLSSVKNASQQLKVEAFQSLFKDPESSYKWRLAGLSGDFEGQKKMLQDRVDLLKVSNPELNEPPLKPGQVRFLPSDGTHSKVTTRQLLKNAKKLDPHLTVIEEK